MMRRRSATGIKVFFSIGKKAVKSVIPQKNIGVPKNCNHGIQVNISNLLKKGRRRMEILES